VAPRQGSRVKLIDWLRSWRPCPYNWMDAHDESVGCRVCAFRRRRAENRRVKLARSRLPAARVVQLHGGRA